MIKYFKIIPSCHTLLTTELEPKEYRRKTVKINSRQIYQDVVTSNDLENRLNYSCIQRGEIEFHLSKQEGSPDCHALVGIYNQNTH